MLSGSTRRMMERSAASAERPAPTQETLSTGDVAIAHESPAANRVRTRVAIADKNPMVRSGLAAYIDRDPRFEVSGIVASGNAFLNLCARNSVDVGVVGWSLPDMTGGDILGFIKRRQSGVRVIVYTGETSPTVLRQAIKVGAWGFMSKSDEPPVLLDTIATVARGRLCLPYVDLQSLTEDPLETLTAREKELLGALANGWTNLQIASRIGISSNTVKYHLKNLYDKLGVNNRAMAVALFISGTRDLR